MQKLSSFSNEVAQIDNFYRDIFHCTNAKDHIW